MGEPALRVLPHAAVGRPLLQLSRRTHPRDAAWPGRFPRQLGDLEGPLIVGLTPVGRATVRLLAMNDEVRVEMRAELQVTSIW